MRIVNCFLLAVAAGALLLAAAHSIPSRTAASVPLQPVIVFLLRHAEKAPAPPKDPPLTDAGSARASALADLLGGAGVTHLFASEFVRTQQTLAPLSARVGIEIAAIGAAKPAELVTQVRGLPAGSIAVVAGHSNTIPALVRALGGTLDGTVQGSSGEQLPDDEYGRLIELILPAPEPAAAAANVTTAAVKSLRLHVGAR
ncbi:MAG: hypothetical protein EXR73_01205 [Myxococcales bacterium]|nr:hypothetical protein [Myxococcales bacterium]